MVEVIDTACGEKPGELSMLCQNFVLALDETARVLLRLYVLEHDVARRRAKERDPTTNDHRNARNGQALNEPSPQKRLDCNAAINVRMSKAAPCERRYDLFWRPRHPLYDCSRGRGPECFRRDRKSVV